MQPREPLTQAEFLAWKLLQDAKHEYVDGYVEPLFGDRSARGFAGGSGHHARLALELGILIGPRVRPCRTYGSVSESTAKIDLGPKMREYQSIAELQEYVTIDSRKRWLQISRRTLAGWELGASASSGGVELRSVGITVDPDTLYASSGIAP